MDVRGLDVRGLDGKVCAAHVMQRVSDGVVAHAREHTHTHTHLRHASRQQAVLSVIDTQPAGETGGLMGDGCTCDA